ncbi:kinesin-domain-containing protein [Marasmius fiardii PR-910]|nr:kinesin-domain-containing protein [Marasmius fiardii PR-910]
MATRRPPSSRSTSNPKAMVLPPPRSRSAMSKSAPSIRFNEEISESSAATIHRSIRKNEDADTNIKVVIRCRRRSEREIQDNSPIILTSDGAKSNQLSIETTPPQSTLGVVTLPPVRTYPFDLVFGPEADQALVYHEVVNPMLEQVVEGYNCTLFAYGQTGTGKTYTMQGDLVPTPMGNPSSHAGMIPRVLFRLFHYLETNKTDFSVKVSYIELYNEELRDLLASDLAAPIGSTQPMGLGSKDNGKAPDIGLKIYEDSNKRGVFIQGVEEIPVKCCADALTLLTKGSHRRQIAATKFNDHSSRSHSIFTLTVHTRENGIVGEDLLRVGKFNLVDLAGSENIGRSGAENKRAREAGMINQSLLTLGRVINALVDKSQHVPYRESKLTRLLQDSLGGHTKTCIIATVSPARSNMEETLSTLDYAMHAKSIKNKPELNQRMTRNSLLKEYIAEMERLKADLLAAREKSGIYISEESWAQLTAEQELRHTELQEAKKQVEIIENQMRAVREEFEQSIGLLMKRDAELKETKEKLEVTEGELLERDVELQGVKVALEEEIIVRKAFEKTEDILDTVATGLKLVANDTTRDLAGLFDKLDRKSSVLDSNSQAVEHHSNTIASATKTLSLNLDEFTETSTVRVTELRQSTQEFGTKGTKTLGACVRGIEKQLQAVNHALQSIHAHDSTEAQALDGYRKVIGKICDTLQTGSKKWEETITATNEEIHLQLDGALANIFSEFANVIRTLYTLLESVLSTTSKFVDSQCESVLAAHATANDLAQAEIVRLRKQNQELLQVVEQQKVESARAKDDLIQRVSGMLGDYVEVRDQNLREALLPMQRANESAIKSVGSFSEQHKTITSGIQGEGAAMSRQLEKAKTQSRAMTEESTKVTTATRESVKLSFANAKRKMSKEVQSHSRDVQAQAEAMSSSCSEAFTTYSNAKRARLDVVETTLGGVRSELDHLHHGLNKVSGSMQTYVEETISHADDLQNMTESHKDIARTNVLTLQQGYALLRKEATRQDVPTGSTPRKRNWEYINSWDLTKGRDVLLQEWRTPKSPVGELSLPGEVPLPDGIAALESDEEETPSANGAHVPLELVDPSPREHGLPGQSLQSSTSSTILGSLPTQLVPPAKGKPKISTSRYPPLADTRNVYSTRSRRPR